MPIFVGLQAGPGSRWLRKEVDGAEVFVLGYAAKHSAFLTGEGLAEELARIAQAMGGHGDVAFDVQSGLKDLPLLNGNFSVVIRRRDVVFAAVDRIRSFPLFYGNRGNDWYLSDDAYWVNERLEGSEFDRLASAEFLYTGYVTGQDTLCSGLKELQAGEWLCADELEGWIRVSTERYYRFLHNDPIELSESDRDSLMERTLVKVFERLLDSSRGRTLFVPLSGGWDSRLIVAMLKLMGREKVVCYSYGLEDNMESAVSKQVAKKLGYPWKFVPYSLDGWHDWFQSEERQHYYRYADGLSSLPSLQDWPAVWEMKQQAVIDDDAIFVPGHSGDFLAGSHIPQSLVNSHEASLDSVVDAILKQHYSLGVISKLDKDLVAAFRKRISGFLPYCPSIGNPEEGVGAFECWDWQERQAKFIVNACRIYEFWGFNWRLPLWDHELMDFFSHLPVQFRLGQAFYVDYLRRQVFSPLGIDFAGVGHSEANRGRLLSAIRQSIAGVPMLKNFYSRLRLPYLRKKAYDGQPLAFFGIISRKQFRELYFPGATFNSFRTMERLGLVSFS
jgi:asparagine synthase (glutamine-hydrolysing)